MKHEFERYCKDYEKIENYQKAKVDNFVGWDCHHRLETHNSDGERRLVDITVAELQALGMYYNRPPEELIFLRKGEHTALRKVSDSTKKKLRAANKGENHPFYGKHHTEESKKKTRRKMKGNKNALGCKRSEETKNKMSLQKTGRHWYNNGKENKYCYECPPGFIPGRLRK